MDHNQQFTQEPEYTYFAGIDVAEDPNLYRLGGFHPVLLGDVLDDRFRVVHKLSRGAAVYCCRCTDTETDTGRLAEQLWRRHLAVPLEHFQVHGPNGSHLCSVLPVLGPSIDNAADHFRAVRAPHAIKDLCLQLVEAMNSLHRMGLCHGDFWPGNILLRTTDDIDCLSEDALVELFGEPVLLAVSKSLLHDENGEYYGGYEYEGHAPNEYEGGELDEGDYSDHDHDHDHDHNHGHNEAEDEYMEEFDETLGPHVPKYLVQPAGLYMDDERARRYISTTIAVIDFGVSFSPETSGVDIKNASTGIPAAYGAPEDIFAKGQLGFASDVWSLAATLFVTVSGALPFSDFFGLKTMMPWLESYLGPLPAVYRPGWERYLDATNTVRHAFEDCGTKVRDDERIPVSRTNESVDKTRERRVKEWGTEDTLEAILRRELRFPAETADTSGTDEGEVEREDGGDVVYDYCMNLDNIAQLADLLRRMFAWMPQDRATLDEVLAHPWFEGHRITVDATDGHDDSDADSAASPNGWGASLGLSVVTARILRRVAGFLGYASDADESELGSEVQ
ncbi:kinase-like domain-containing protein [Lasiosphaeria miniovina]|uniref:Kinase-like domain-containing protein n=1 Tax=Lasiosphaeria miniovina TaxID=1954250 RepID=A0AA40AJ36_9PEZI|nr:kinase-like domain-containing protein [Lasiosphaeria miniovina]KAK0716798.1 kinase-like domain-containing protein [Lasiosphaeria miniovina]